jgi:glycerophosphoryl diester phosphodiesterase
VIVLGHRGAVHPTAPENTLASVDRALRQGADGVEVDVRVTADGIPVCLHDPTLLRTADDRREVSAVPYVDLPWVGSHRIPRLSEVIDLVAGRGRLVIEVKSPSGEHAPLGEVVDAVAAVLRRHRTDHVTVSSFDRLRLRMLRQLELGCPTALLGRPAAPFRGLLRQAEQDGHPEVHAHLSSVLNHLRDSPQVAPGVVTWTVDRPRDLLTLRDAGVEAVIADDPRSVREVLSDPYAAVG